MPLGNSTAEHSEILGKNEDEAAVYRARSGDHAIAGNMLFVHAEVGAVMLDIHVHFLEAAFVEQDIQPLARGEAALGVL